MDLKNKKILIVIGGGISAYKSLDLIRLLIKNNVEVKTILTKSGKEFVTPLSITSLTKNKTFEDIFDNNNAADVENDSETRVLLGFHFPISENMDLAPVLKYNIVEANDDPATDEDESASIDFGVNFQFKF